MEYLISGLVLTFLVLLVLGAATGRINLGACCSIADPSRDLRMRAAYESEPGQERTMPSAAVHWPAMFPTPIARWQIRPLIDVTTGFRHDEHEGRMRCSEGSW